MSLTWEKWYPAALAALTLVLAAVFLRDVSSKTIETLLGHGLNVAAISVGFLATALSILVSLEQRRVTQVLRDAGYLQDIVRYFNEAIWLWLVVALSSGGLLVMHERVPVPYRWVPFGVWMGATVWAVMALYRITRVFGKLLRTSQS